MEMYNRVSLPSSILPKETALTSGEFLTLQSFLLSLKDDDVRGADRALASLFISGNEITMQLGIGLIEMLVHGQLQQR
jgi:hypothetical protein